MSIVLIQVIPLCCYSNHVAERKDLGTILSASLGSEPLSEFEHALPMYSLSDFLPSTSSEVRSHG